MGVLTTFLKLLKPSENDYYNQQTEQADNWDKVDNYAVLTNTDKNAVWGGEYGGKIQDPIPKELNKRYIDNINGKAFICIKAGDSSVVSNTMEYFTPCNVVDNLDKLQNLYNTFALQTTQGDVSVLKRKIGDITEYLIKDNRPGGISDGFKEITYPILGERVSIVSGARQHVGSRIQNYNYSIGFESDNKIILHMFRSNSQGLEAFHLVSVK